MAMSYLKLSQTIASSEQSMTIMSAKQQMQNGLYMPAEWAAHQCCWMAWPMRLQTWPRGLPHREFAAVANAIAEHEPVRILVDHEYLVQARSYCNHPNIQFVTLPTSDIWLRDTAPTFVFDSDKLQGINWQFNAWGEAREQVEDYAADVKLAQNILQYLQLDCVHAALVLEGGAIHVDGEGSLLTTTECLLNSSRNPNLSQEQIENYLREYLGVEQIIWLQRGLEDDETAGHIDNIACFIRPGIVAALSCSDPQDANYAILQENIEQLRQTTDAQGRTLKVIPIEQPARRDAEDFRLALSYINFYLANTGVIVPTFADEKRDIAALNQIQALFPQRKVVAVDGLELAYGGGCVHCMTQQQPLIK
jgi:agmatine deiminase